MNKNDVYITQSRKSRHRFAAHAVRPVEVRPVGAWVQPEMCSTNNAVVLAQHEDARLKQLTVEKQTRLAQFQQEVRQRVAIIDRMKKKLQLDLSQKQIDVERGVLVSATSARKNSSTVRQEETLCIQTTPKKDVEQNRTATSHNQQLHDQLHQVHKLHALARQSLCTRQSDVDLADLLPGGVWSNMYNKQYIPLNCNDPVTSQSEDYQFDNIEDNVADNSDVMQHVHFEPRQSIEDTSTARPGIQVCNVPDIYPGVVSEEQRTRSRQQRALYRRLFMDIEREQVKETLRHKQQSVKMSNMKRTKEADRLRVEQQCQSSMDAMDTSPTQSEQISHQLTETSIQELQKCQRKNTETARFIQALKCGLRDRVVSQRIAVPQLCSCAPTAWDTNPDMCANNCLFYKNPKGYAKALQSLLTSCDI